MISTPPIGQMNADLRNGRSDCTTIASWTAQTCTEKSEEAKTQESMNFNRSNGTRGTVVRAQDLHGRRRNPRDRSCLFPILLKSPPAGLQQAPAAGRKSCNRGKLCSPAQGAYTRGCNARRMHWTIARRPYSEGHLVAVQGPKPWCPRCGQ